MCPVVNRGHLQIEMLLWATGNHQLAESCSPLDITQHLQGADGWVGRQMQGRPQTSVFILAPIKVQPECWCHIYLLQSLTVFFFLNQIPFNPQTAQVWSTGLNQYNTQLSGYTHPNIAVSGHTKEVKSVRDSGQSLSPHYQDNESQKQQTEELWWQRHELTEHSEPQQAWTP